ncbi:avidin-related protein 7-like [Lissotriton helveticus]
MGLGAVSGVTLLLLGFFAVSASAVCRVSGLWETIKNSSRLTKMTIDLNNDGLFNGTYWEAGASIQSNLTGYQQDEELPTFGFTVKSVNSANTIVYVGHCYLPPGGEDILITTRIVKEHSLNPTDFRKMKANQVNFTRISVV